MFRYRRPGPRTAGSRPGSPRAARRWTPGSAPRGPRSPGWNLQPLDLADRTPRRNTLSPSRNPFTSLKSTSMVVRGLHVHGPAGAGLLHHRAQPREHVHGHYKIDVLFENVKGLREGDNVFVRGVDVGKIKSLQIPPGGGGVHVSATLEQPLQLHEDYRIEILPSSVLGGRYLNIYEGSDGRPLLPEAAIVRGIEPVDLIDEATRTIQMVKEALEEGEILENLKVAVEQIREVTTKLNKGEGTIGKLLTDETMYKDLRGDRGESQGCRASGSRTGKGTLGKLMSEDDRCTRTCGGGELHSRRSPTPSRRGRGRSAS